MSSKGLLTTRLLVLMVANWERKVRIRFHMYNA